MLIIDDEPETIEEVTDEAKCYSRQFTSNLISLGERLKVAQDLVPAAKWEDWLDRNFDMTPRTARKIMMYSDFLDKGGDIESALNRFY